MKMAAAFPEVKGILFSEFCLSVKPHIEIINSSAKYKGGLNVFVVSDVGSNSKMNYF